MDSFKSLIQLVFLYNFLPIFPQHVMIKTTAIWQRHVSLFHSVPILSPTQTFSVHQSCSTLTISVLPFSLSLAPLWGSNTQRHIFLWLWDSALHLLSRSTDPWLLSPAGLCPPGRLLVSRPSHCGCCSTQCLPSLEGGFRGQYHHGFCASAAHSGKAQPAVHCQGAVTERTWQGLE